MADQHVAAQVALDLRHDRRVARLADLRRDPLGVPAGVGHVGDAQRRVQAE